MAINIKSDRKRSDVRADAAELAKEADELMAEMALTLKYLADEPFNSGTAAVMVQKYNTRMERKQ
jgi:hypothetical protein